jgi:peptidoglycan/xylan/chitin deacetylase (PgdA/CDA1 family)
MSLVAAVLIVLATSAGSSKGTHSSPPPHKTASAAASQRQTASEARAMLTSKEDAAIDRLLARQPFIRAGGIERREIALTFDDGPGPYTPRLLDQLERLHVPATFFEVGFMFRWFHDSASRVVKLGDVIGDHTETHPRMAALAASAQLSQIVDQTQWVRTYGGPFPRLWRPPFGSYNATTLAILRREKMLMVLWTIDTSDYLRPGVKVIVQRALAGAKPGAIILMHDGGGNRTQTIEALPLIAKGLRARGYKLVTIPQLILDDPPQRTEPLPTSLAGD